MKYPAIHRVCDEVLAPPFNYLGSVVYRGREAGGSFHSHEGCQVVVVTQGSVGFLAADDRCSRICAGEAVIVAPGVRHNWRAVGTGTARFLAFLVDPGVLRRSGDLARFFEPGGGIPWRRARLGPDGAAVVRRIARELESRRPWRGSVLAGYLAALVGLLARELAGREEPGKDAARWPLLRVMDHVEANLHRPLPLRELAACAGLGVSRFSELFRRSVGASPGQHVRTLRLRRAELLLAYSELSVKQVARQLGFGSEALFSRAFKRHAGVSPSRFRIVRNAKRIGRTGS